MKVERQTPLGYTLMLDGEEFFLHQAEVTHPIEVGETIEEQTTQVFENLKGLLADAGSSLDQAIKTTVFIKNMDDFAKVNEIYATYFTGAFPARSCVEVARLPKDLLIEVEVTAIKG